MSQLDELLASAPLNGDIEVDPLETPRGLASPAVVDYVSQHNQPSSASFPNGGTSPVAPAGAPPGRKTLTLLSGNRFVPSSTAHGSHNTTSPSTSSLATFTNPRGLNGSGSASQNSSFNTSQNRLSTASIAYKPTSNSALSTGRYGARPGEQDGQAGPAQYSHSLSFSATTSPRYQHSSNASWAVTGSHLQPYTQATRGLPALSGSGVRTDSASDKYFITVLPPPDYPMDTVAARRGALVPLYPTLSGQLYAIARELSLPSIGGIALYLQDDGEGNPGPKVGDRSWSGLWKRHFEEEEEERVALEAQRATEADAQSMASRNRSDASWHRRKRPNGHAGMGGAGVGRSVADANGINASMTTSPTHNSAQDSLSTREDEEHLADMPGPNGQMYADADETGLSSGLSNSGAELDGSSAYDIVSSRGSLGFRRQRSSVSTRRNTNGAPTGVRKDSVNSGFSQDGRTQYPNNRHMRQASSRASARARELDTSGDPYSATGPIPIEAGSRHSSVSLNPAQHVSEFANMRSVGAHHSPRASLFQAQSQARMYNPMSSHIPGMSGSLSGPGSGLRLPIVARFEWTVERSRPAAAWWDIWCERERARINQNAPHHMPVSATSMGETTRAMPQHAMDASERLTAPRELSTASLSRISPRRVQQTPRDLNGSGLTSRARDPYTPDVSASQREVDTGSISRVLAQNFAAPPSEVEDPVKAPVQPKASSASSRWSAVSSQREVPSDRSFEAEAEADTPSTTLQEVKSQTELSPTEEIGRSVSDETIGAGVLSVQAVDHVEHALPPVRPELASKIALFETAQGQHAAPQHLEGSGQAYDEPVNAPIDSMPDVQKGPVSFDNYAPAGERGLNSIYDEQPSPASNPFEGSQGTQFESEQSFDAEEDFEAYPPHFQGHPSIKLTASSTTNSIQVHSPTHDQEVFPTHSTVVTPVDTFSEAPTTYREEHQLSRASQLDEAEPVSDVVTAEQQQSREAPVVGHPVDERSHVMAEILPASLGSGPLAAGQFDDSIQHDSDVDDAHRAGVSTFSPGHDSATRARIASSGWTSESSPRTASIVTSVHPPPPRPQRPPPPPPPRRLAQEAKSRFVAPSYSLVQEEEQASPAEITADRDEHVMTTPSASLTNFAASSEEVFSPASEYSPATDVPRSVTSAPDAAPEQPTLLMQHVFGLFSGGERAAEHDAHPPPAENVAVEHEVPQYASSDAKHVTAGDGKVHPQESALREVEDYATEPAALHYLPHESQQSDDPEQLQHETTHYVSDPAEVGLADSASDYLAEYTEPEAVESAPVVESVHSATTELPESPAPHRALERVSVLSSRPQSILSMESKGSDSTVRASFVDATSHLSSETHNDETPREGIPAETAVATGPPLPPRSPSLSQAPLEVETKEAPLLPPRPPITPQLSEALSPHPPATTSTISAPPVPPRPPFISHDSLAQLDVLSHVRALPVEPVARQPRPYLRYDDIESRPAPIERANNEQPRPYLRFDDMVAEDEDSDSSGEHTPTHEDPDEDEEHAVARRNAAIEARLAARNQDRGWSFRPSRGFFNFGFKRRLSPAGLEDAKTSPGVPPGGQGFDDDSSDEDEDEEADFEPKEADKVDEPPTQSKEAASAHVAESKLAVPQSSKMVDENTAPMPSIVEPSLPQVKAKAVQPETGVVTSMPEQSAESSADVEHVLEARPVSSTFLERKVVHQPPEATHDTPKAQTAEIETVHRAEESETVQTSAAEATHPHILQPDQNREASVLELTQAQVAGATEAVQSDVADVDAVPDQPGGVRSQPAAEAEVDEAVDEEEQSSSEDETNKDVIEEEDDAAAAKRDAAILSRLEARNKTRGWAFRPSRLMNFGLGRKRSQSEATGGFGWRSLSRQKDSDSSSDEEEEEPEEQQQQQQDVIHEETNPPGKEHEPGHEHDVQQKLEHEPTTEQESEPLLEHEHVADREHELSSAMLDDPKAEGQHQAQDDLEHPVEPIDEPGAGAAHQLQSNLEQSPAPSHQIYEEPQNELLNNVEHQDEYKVEQEFIQPHEQGLERGAGGKSEGELENTEAPREWPHQLDHSPEADPKFELHHQLDLQDRAEYQHEYSAEREALAPQRHGDQFEAELEQEGQNDFGQQHTPRPQFAQWNELEDEHEFQQNHGLSETHEENRHQQMFENEHLENHQQYQDQSEFVQQYDAARPDESSEGESKIAEEEPAVQRDLGQDIVHEVDTISPVESTPVPAAATVSPAPPSTEVYSHYSSPHASSRNETTSPHDETNESFDDAEDDRGSDGFSSVPETSVTTHIDQLTAMLGALGTDQHKYSGDLSERQSMRPEASHVPHDAIQEDEAELTFVEARSRSLTRRSSDDDEHDQIQFALDALQPPGGYQPLHHFEHDDHTPIAPLRQSRTVEYAHGHNFDDVHGGYPIAADHAYGEQVGSHQDAISLEGDDRTSRPISGHGRISLLADGAYLGVASESDHAWTPLSGGGSTPFEFDEYEAVSDDEAEEPEDQHHELGHEYQQVDDAGHLNHEQDGTPTLNSHPTLGSPSHADQTVFSAGPLRGMTGGVAQVAEEDDRDETDSGNAHWAQILQQSSRFSTSSLGHFESAKSHMSTVSQDPPSNIPPSPTVAVAPQH